MWEHYIYQICPVLSCAGVLDSAATLKVLVSELVANLCMFSLYLFLFYYTSHLEFPGSGLHCVIRREGVYVIREALVDPYNVGVQHTV